MADLLDVSVWLPLTAPDHVHHARARRLAEWSGSLDVRGGQWTDAYLAAFAAAGGHRLVAFDADFSRYPGLAFLHLRP